MGEEQEMETVRKSKLQKDIDYLHEKINRVEEITTHQPSYTEAWVITFFVTFIFSVIAILIFVPFDSPSQSDFCHEKFGNYSWSESTGDINPKYFMCKSIDENNTIIKKYVTNEEYEQWKKTK